MLRSFGRGLGACKRRVVSVGWREWILAQSWGSQWSSRAPSTPAENQGWGNLYNHHVEKIRLWRQVQVTVRIHSGERGGESRGNKGREHNNDNLFWRDLRKESSFFCYDANLKRGQLYNMFSRQYLTEMMWSIYEIIHILNCGCRSK